jgi:signal peptidase I
MYFISQFLVQTVHVVGNSMHPTLHHNDYLIATKISYRLHDPQRGDIVVFLPSLGGNEDFIKRVIAVPGDRVRIANAQIFINGHRLKEDYVVDGWRINTTFENGQEFKMGPGEYWVMGDNRDHSRDSRDFGPQKRDSFLGPAWVRIWPLSDATFFVPQSQFAT